MDGDMEIQGDQYESSTGRRCLVFESVRFKYAFAVENGDIIWRCHYYLCCARIRTDQSGTILRCRRQNNHRHISGAERRRRRYAKNRGVSSGLSWAQNGTLSPIAASDKKEATSRSSVGSDTAREAIVQLPKKTTWDASGKAFTRTYPRLVERRHFQERKNEPVNGKNSSREATVQFPKKTTWYASGKTFTRTYSRSVKRRNDQETYNVPGNKKNSSKEATVQLSNVQDTNNEPSWNEKNSVKMSKGKNQNELKSGETTNEVSGKTTRQSPAKMCSQSLVEDNSQTSDNKLKLVKNLQKKQNPKSQRELRSGQTTVELTNSTARHALSGIFSQTTEDYSSPAINDERANEKYFLKKLIRKRKKEKKFVDVTTGQISKNKQKQISENTVEDCCQAVNDGILQENDSSKKMDRTMKKFKKASKSKSESKEEKSSKTQKPLLEKKRNVATHDEIYTGMEMSEDPQGADQPLGDPNQAHHPSQPFHDYHNDQESHANTSTGNTTHAHSEYSNNGTGDDIGNSFDTETYSARNPDARNNADKENDSQDSMESSSSRPRRSCRGRRWGGGGGDDGYVKDSHASQAISTEDGDKGTSHKKKQSGQQKAINEEGEGSGNSVKTKEQEQDDFCNDRSKLQDSGEGRGAGKKDDDEPRLFTIESVRTVTENEEMDEEHDDKDEVGKDDDSSGTYSPGASDTSSPPAKKRKSSSKKSSASHPQPVLLNPQPGAAPIFCRIDPAFCKFQTVFQVPFASSPTFFSRTADSMVVSNGTNVSTAIANDGDNNSVAESSKTSPKSVSLLANRSDTAVSADNAGDKSDPLSRRVIKSPAAIPAKHISITPPTSDASPADPASVCTLPCCSGKPSNPVIASLPFKPMDIKQEAPDPDDPSQPQPHQTVRTLSPPSSLPASGDPVPYRSDPIFLARTSTTVSSSNTINTNSSGSSVVPYRSEPLRKLPRPLPPISALPADFSHKIETREKGHSCQSWSRSDSQMTQENGSRSDSQPTQESFQTKQESFNGNDYPPGKKSLINDITPQKEFPLISHPRSSSGGGGSAKRSVGGGGSKMSGWHSTSSRPLVSRQQGITKSGSSASVPSSASRGKSSVDTVASHLMATSRKASSPVSLFPQDKTSNATVGPFFIRRDHVLDDLMDVFKHSADRIHRGSLFRLCRDVSGVNNATSLSLDTLQDNWEDVAHKTLFSMFWAECLKTYFDGFLQKVPKVDSSLASTSSSDVPYVLGKILRHGLVLCGYWPAAVSPACAVSVFTGEKCSQALFLDSLRHVMFPFEAEALEDLRESARGSGVERFLRIRAEKRVGLAVQSYGGNQCQVPTRCDEVEAFVVELAAYYLYCQPFWWLREMRRGLLSVTDNTRKDQDYLTSMGEREVVDMYLTLAPTPQAILQRTRFRIDESKQVSQNRVKGFLERSLLRLSRQQLLQLMMRWSDADCLLDDSYLVIFSSSSSSASPASSSSSGAPSGTPPFFRPAVNTLVLGQTCPSFDVFDRMFRMMVKC